MRARRGVEGLAGAARRTAMAAVAAVPTALALAGGIRAMDRTVAVGCESREEASFVTAFDPPTGAYLIQAVLLPAVAAACDGSTFSVTLSDGLNRPVASATYTDPAGPDGQLDPHRGDLQHVRLDLRAQRVRVTQATLISTTIHR